jgi:hypothetical protein
MAIFQYNPPSMSLPSLPKITSSATTAQPATVGNQNLKMILDNLKKNISAPEAFTSKNNINDQLFASQELGNQFIKQNLLPEFQQNTYNPFQRQLSNSAAGSNLSLLGGANKIYQQKTRDVVRPFNDQALQVQDQFSQTAYQNLGDQLKAYYDSQLKF